MQRIVKRRGWVAATLVVLLTGCEDDRPGEAPADAEPEPATVDSAARPGGARTGPELSAGDRPRFVVDTMEVEGSPEPARLGLFRSPDAFPLPFSTYLPAELVAEWSGRGEEGLRFVANFDGETDRTAYVHVVPRTADTHAAGALARSYEGVDGRRLGGAMRPMRDLTFRYPFAQSGWEFGYEVGEARYDGALLLLVQENRFVQLVVHYPVKLADTFVPRAGLIFQHWRWADGTPLD